MNDRLIEAAAVTTVPAAWIAFFADTLPVLQWFAAVFAIAVAAVALIGAGVRFWKWIKSSN